MLQVVMPCCWEEMDLGPGIDFVPRGCLEEEVCAEHHGDLTGEDTLLK